MRPIKFLWVCAIVLFSYSVNAQNWEKKEDKIEALLEDGKYRKAERNAKRLAKKATKKLGDSHVYRPLLAKVLAEHALHMGEWHEYETHVGDMISQSGDILGDTSQAYAYYLLEAARIWEEAGYKQKAFDYLQEAKQLYGENTEDEVQVDIIRLETKLLVEMGHYVDAQQLVRDSYEFMHAYGSNKQGNKKEQRQRYQQFAGFVVTASQAALDRGNIDQADSLLRQHEKEFKKKLGKYAWERVAYTKLRARIYEHTNNPKEAKRLYQEAYALSIKKRRIEDKRITPYRKAEIEALYKFDSPKDGSKATKLFSEIAKKAFKRSSYHRLAAEYMEAYRSINEGKDKDAEKKLRTIIENTASLPEVHPLRLEAYQLLYLLQVKQHKFTDGFENLAQQLKLSSGLYGEDGAIYHLMAMQRAAHLFEYTDELQDVAIVIESSYKGVLENELLPQHGDYVKLRKLLVQYYSTTDQYELALKTLEDAIAATRTKPNNGHAYGQQLVQLANLLYKMGRLEEVNHTLDAAEKILDPMKQRQDIVPVYSEMLFQKARMLGLQGEFGAAEKILNTSTRYLRRNKVDRNEENVPLAELLAEIYIHTGQYAEAEGVLKEAITTSEAKFGVNNRRILAARLAWGRLKLQQGDYASAMEIAELVEERASVVFSKNALQHASALMLKAETSTSLGDHQQAATDITKALQVYTDILGERHFEVAQMYAKLAMALFADNSANAQVHQYLQKAAKIIEDRLGIETPAYAQLLTYTAYLNIAEGKYPEAFKNLEAAEKVWVKKVGKRNNVNAATINLLLGDVHYNLYDYRKARQHYQKSARLFERYFNDSHPEYVTVLAKTSRLEYMEGNEKRAIALMETVMAHYDRYIQAFFPILSEREKTRFWNSIKEDYELYNSLIIKNISNQNDKAIAKLYDNALNTKALLLNTSIRQRQNIVNSGDEQLANDFNDWVYSKEVLSSVLGLSAQELMDQGVNKDSLIQVINNLERSLSQRSELFGDLAERQHISWQDVKSALKPHEVAVEMIRFRHFDHTFSDSVIYAALVLKNESKQDKPEIIVLEDGNAIEKKYFNNYRNSIVYGIEDDISYYQYWKPIEDKVGKVATIYFSPEGVYNQINLDAIPYPDGRYIMDNFNIILIGNTKDLYLRQFRPTAEASSDQAVLYGDPQFYVDASLARGHQTITQLPGTHKEVEEVSKLFEMQGWETNVFLTSAAKETQVKAMVNPRVFHIATHGFYEPTPKHSSNQAYLKSHTEDNPLLRSGLMLKGAGDIIAQNTHNYNVENGILTAYEAMNLNLSQTDLVVLSACETGLGDISIGEGVNGLQKAFLVAGAKVLIMSLFKVDDDVTRILMTNFYKHWLETNDIRGSFTAARNIVRDKYPEPIYWGAFVVFGLE